MPEPTPKTPAKRGPFSRLFGRLRRTPDPVRVREELFRTTLASIGDGVVATDAGGRVTFLNAVAEALTGWQLADASGRPLTEVFRIVNEASRAEVDNPALRALERGVIVGLANHTILISKDGTERPIDDSAAPIRDDSGRVIGAVLVFRDIFERKREERAVADRAKLVALRADVAGFLARTGPTRAALDECCQAFVRHLDAAFARVWTLPPGGDVLELQASAGVYSHIDGGHARVPVGQFKIGRIAASRRPHLSNDVLNDPEIGDPAWAAREKMVSFAGYPLVVEERVVGVLALFGRRAIGDDVLADLAPLAEAVAQYLDRKRQETEIAEREREFAVLADSIPQLTWMADAEGNIFWYNRQWYAYTGTTLEQMQGWGWQSVHDPAELPRVLEQWRTALAKGESFDAMFPLRGADGVFRPFLTRASAVKDSAGRVVRWCGTNTDISGPLKAQERERQLLNQANEASAKFRAFFDQGPLLAGLMSLDGTLIEANRLSWEGCGFRQNQVIGIPFWEGPWWKPIPESIAQIRAGHVQALTGELFRAELGYEVGDGSRRVVDFMLLPIRDESGRVAFLAPTGMDVTDRRRAEDESNRNEYRWRLALQSGGLGAWNLDLTTFVIQTDRRFRDLFGLPGDDCAYQAAFDRIHPDDRDRVGAAVAAAIRVDDPAPYAEEYRTVHPDGTVLWVHAEGRVNFEGDGPTRRAVSFDGTVADVTERRRLEDELRRTAADLSEADRRKDEFLATLAHELRNPLAPIRTGLQVMKLSKTIGKEAEDAQAIMGRQLAQMVRLVDDLLDVSAG